MPQCNVPTLVLGGDGLMSDVQMVGGARYYLVTARVDGRDSGAGSGIDDVERSREDLICP